MSSKSPFLLAPCFLLSVCYTVDDFHFLLHFSRLLAHDHLLARALSTPCPCSHPTSPSASSIFFDVLYLRHAFLCVVMCLQVTAEGEVLVKFALQFKKLEDAVAAVIEFLGEC